MRLDGQQPFCCRMNAPCWPLPLLGAPLLSGDDKALGPRQVVGGHRWHSHPNDVDWLHVVECRSCCASACPCPFAPSRREFLADVSARMLSVRPSEHGRGQA